MNMTNQSNILASIEVNLQQAMQRKKPEGQTVKFELDGQVRACCLPKLFTYSDLLKSIDDLYGSGTSTAINHIQYLFSRDDALRLPITNDDDLNKVLAIAETNGLNKLSFSLRRQTNLAMPRIISNNINYDSGSISDDEQNLELDDNGRDSPPPGIIVPQKRPTKPNITRKSTISSDGGVFIPEIIDDTYSSGSSSIISRESSGNEYQSKRHFRSISMAKRTASLSNVISNNAMNSNTYSSQTSANDFLQRQCSCSTRLDKYIPQTPSNWKLGRLLGQGAFGKVSLCYDVDTGSELAIKQIPIRGINSETIREVKFLESEINVYKQLDHERVVRYYGVLQTNDYLQIFMEYMVGGSVREQLSNYGALTEQLTKKYTKQILNGLVYLHENRYIHRDIKCANILRDISGNIKLGDFGTSKRLIAITNQNQPDSGTIGTAHWTAPEVIQGSIYGRKADIWSLGCTIVEMLTTGPPWQHLQPIAAIFHIVTCDKPEYKLPEIVTKLAREFIDACLTKDYNLRPTASDLLNYSFLSDLSST